MSVFRVHVLILTFIYSGLLLGSPGNDSSEYIKLEAKLNVNKEILLTRIKKLKGLFGNEVISKDAYFRLLQSKKFETRPLIYYGDNTPLNRYSEFEEEISNLEIKARKGSLRAVYLLAHLKIYHLNNCEDGLKLLNQAKSKGLSVAITTLASVYEFGTCGIEVSIEKAISLYEKSALTGEPESLYRLSILAATGRYEVDEGWLSLLRKSAEFGLPEAQLHLASTYKIPNTKWNDESLAWFLISYVNGQGTLDTIKSFEKFDEMLKSNRIKKILTAYGSYRFYIYGYIDRFGGAEYISGGGD